MTPIVHYIYYGRAWATAGSLMHCERSPESTTEQSEGIQLTPKRNTPEYDTG